MLLLLVPVLLMSSCSVGPNYEPPPENTSEMWSSSYPGTTSEKPINTDWWSMFQDPLLEKYIERSIENNKDIKIALANLRSARALQREQAGVFWPEFGGNASGDRSRLSGAVSSFNSGQIRDTFDARFDASWEIDIFGGNRRSYEAAEARIGASFAEYADIMLSTLSDVARTYYEIRGLQKRITITEQNTQLLKETFDVIEARLIAGETSDFDLTRARGEYQLTSARIPNLKAEQKASTYTLSVLLGTPPETLLHEMEAIEPLPTPPDIVPIGLRSEILRRRPDIRIAERQLAASVAEIGVQTSELFPKFFLTGDIGSQARLFGDLFSTGSGVWSLASVIQWSIFEGGALRARIEMREAQNEAALAAYEKSVLEAIQDVETALTRYGQELETRKLLAEAVESRRKSVSLARELFDAGEQDYLAVVDAERQLRDSEDELILSETSSITKLIALYTGLGGGWEHFEKKQNEESNASRLSY